MESLQRDISDERDARRPDGRDELDKSNSPATRPKRNRRDKRDNGIDMLNGPLPGKILRFAIPLALSSILQQLLNSADASIAGQFVSSFSLAGIGGVNPVTAMFVNLFVGPQKRRAEVVDGEKRDGAEVEPHIGERVGEGVFGHADGVQHPGGQGEPGRPQGHPAMSESAIAVWTLFLMLWNSPKTNS